MYKYIKRGLDIVLSGLAIVCSSPFWIATIIGIEISDPGPIFYKANRIGKDNKEFLMYKFRSMCMNADETLKEYLKNNEEARKEFKKYKKLKKDPRITKVGKVLRETSLDEFPQLINVLLGNMSLVGPRPYLPREKEDMGEYYSSIIKVKPGITGYWQIRGRSKTSFNDRLKMDLQYVNNCSLKNDIKILVKTFSKVFKRDGAI